MFDKFKNILIAKENRVIIFSVLVLSVCLFVFLIYKYISFGHSYPHYSFKEYYICENSSKIKDEGKIKISEKGVCFESDICKQLAGIVECENIDKNNYKRDIKVVKKLNKDNFNFENINVANDNILFLFKDRSGAVVLANEKYFEIKNVDIDTFQYLGGKYSKDKKHIYYKSEIIEADSETFIYEKGKGKAIEKGRDKNGTWVKGALKE